MALKALLFDLDGTLADTDPVHRRTWEAFLAPLGMVVDEAFYHRHILGKLNAVIFAELMPDLPADSAALLGAQKEAKFREMSPDLDALPGLPAFLDRMAAAGVRLAVVTNAPRANAEHVLAATGLADRFETIISGDELPAGKPDPLPYLEGLRFFGVTADEAVAFEDSASGLTSAVGAGIATVGITSSLKPAELLGLGASLTIGRYDDPALETLIAGRV